MTSNSTVLHSSASNLLYKYWIKGTRGQLVQSSLSGDSDLKVWGENAPDIRNAKELYQKYNLDRAEFPVLNLNTPLLPCFADKSVNYAKRMGMIEIDNMRFTLKSSAFQKMRASSGWAQLPTLASFDETREGYDSFVECVLEVEHIRLGEFVNRVLGLRLGTSRPFGRFFYSHSYPLYCPKRMVEVGSVMFGGNKDTIFFDISGTGCKHVFTHTNKQRLHHWLKFFDVEEFTRIDLFFDDFDGLFSPEHALIAYTDLAFNRFRGGRTPKAEPKYQYENGVKVMLDIIRIGSRSSLVFWRCYNKAAEQNYDGIWNRSEVELKRISIDVLLCAPEYFASLCPYSASMNIETASEFDLVRRQKAKAIATLKKKTDWIRRMCGKAIYDLVEDWGLSAEECLILMIGADSDGNCKHGGAVSSPPIFSELLRCNYV